MEEMALSAGEVRKSAVRTQRKECPDLVRCPDFGAIRVASCPVY